jgi:hypothetical protein
VDNVPATRNGKAAVYLGGKFLIRKMEGARTKIGTRVLVVPGVKTGCRAKEFCQVRLANQRNRKALALVDDVEPSAH